MGDHRKKRHPVLTILILLSWFLIFLPSIKLFFVDILSPSFEFRQFEETENDLSTLIQSENALFPDDFILKLSKWESYNTNWRSNWHIYMPYLEASIFELENLDFHRAVRNGFLEIAKQEPKRVKIVSAMGTPEEIHQKIVEFVKDVI